MSGDPKDDYFSDGLSEELLNTLAAVQGLKVAARTSSFSFRGKDEAVDDIARKLNIAALLEGSVRHDKSHVRIATELIDTATGFQLWSHTYDRDLKDVLALQTDIATAVAAALKVTLLETDAGSIEVGGTDNAKAFDAYLRAEQLARLPLSAKSSADTLSAYDEAIALDPRYANAYLGRGNARIAYAFNGESNPEEEHRETKLGLQDARKAAELAPALGAAHAVIGYALNGELNFIAAAPEFEKGLDLSPGDARVHTHSAYFLAQIGRFEEAIARARHAVELDPLNWKSHALLAYAYFWARRYPESVEAGRRALALDPSRAGTLGWQGMAYAGLGNYEAARASCDTPKPDWVSLTCLAIVYHKLGRDSDAQATFAQMKQQYGSDTYYQDGEIYAQWGDVPHALERAVAAVDPGLVTTKVDPLLDPVRGEPRFKAMLAHLALPD
jgi:TolB-like protein